MVPAAQFFHLCNNGFKHIRQTSGKVIVPGIPEIADVFCQTFDPSALNPGIDTVPATERFIIFTEIPSGYYIEFRIDIRIKAMFRFESADHYGHAGSNQILDYRFHR